MMTSGARRSPRNWSITAVSISAACTSDRARPRPALQHRLADIVPIESVPAPRVRRCHGAAGRPKQQSLQQRRCRRPRAPRLDPGTFTQDRVHPVPEHAVNNRRMFTGIRGAPVDGLADIHPVVQQLVEKALVDQFAPTRRHPFRDQAPHQRRRRAHLGESLEYHAHCCGLSLVDQQLAVPNLVAERHKTAHPHAAFAGGGEFVADALADDLAFELGERQ